MPWGERNVGDFRGVTLGQTVGTSGSRTGHALNAAFSRGVSGPAVGIRFRALANQPINEVYAFVFSTTGTRANVSLVARIWDAAASGTQPGTVLRATSNASALPSADLRWIRFAFPTPYTPSVGEYVFITIENTATAPATDFCSLQNASAAQNPNTNVVTAFFTTTNGFSSAGTAATEGAHVVLQGSNVVAGNHVTAQGSLATFVGKRGILLSQDIKRFKIRWGRVASANNNWTNLQIYDFATPPTGTPLLNFVMPAGLDRLAGIAELNWDLSTLPGPGPFVLCQVFSASNTVVQIGDTEDYATFSSVFDLFSADNFSYAPYVQETAGSWVVNRRYFGGLYLEANDIAATGGGLRLFPGFNGGLDG